MILIDHLTYRVYNTYNRLNKVVKLYKGPEHQASLTLSLILPVLLFIISVYLGVWKEPANLYIQFLASFPILLFGFASIFYFKKTIKKVRSKFKDEPQKQKSPINCISKPLFSRAFYPFS